MRDPAERQEVDALLEAIRYEHNLTRARQSVVDLLARVDSWKESHVAAVTRAKNAEEEVLEAGAIVARLQTRLAERDAALDALVAQRDALLDELADV